MFNNIIGNTNNKNILQNSIKNDKISHSYIFSGPKGIGKMLFAKEFAKAILCDNIENKPCNHCKACIEFENANHPDIYIIDEQDETIKTETMKNLTKDILEKPLENKKKIYIINNSENMTREAQNTLLKTLEEPPQYIVIILITANTNLMLNTIKSRCINIIFNKLTNEELKKYFKDNITEEVLNFSEGSISKALKIKENEDTYKQISNEIKRIEQLNELEILKLKSIISTKKEDIEEILEYINLIFYNVIINNPTTAIKYNNCIKIIEDTNKRLKRNGNYDMTIDNCLLSIWEEING